MGTQIALSMAKALLLTVILEAGFAAIWGVKDRRGYIFLLLVNLLTNPAVNFIYSFFRIEMNFDGAKLAVLTIFLEISAIIAEGAIYKRHTDIDRPFIFSAGANIFSYFSGAVILSLLT